MTSNRTVGLLGHAYCRGYLYRATRLSGALHVAFFRWAYPGFTIGRNPLVWGGFSLQLMEGGRMEIGDNFHLVSAPPRSAITLFGRGQFTVFPNATIRLGNHVGLNGTALCSKRRIEIGDDTMIAPNVIIVDSDFHAAWPPELRWTSSTKESDREVIIGRNVWIGMNTIVLKGTRIGDNTIIGAGSVVSGEIPADCVAAGNPARPIRTLEPEVAVVG